MHKRKRSLISLLILISFQSAMFSQSRKPNNDELNLYAQALFASIAKMKSSWVALSDKRLDRVPTNYDRMIVEKQAELTDNLPGQVGEAQIEYLDRQGLIERAQKLKKAYLILVGHPMKTEGKRVKISFTTHWITYGKRRLTYAVSDWSNVYFRYDCEQEKYVIDEVNLGGI
jgi:hypothetical protein